MMCPDHVKETIEKVKSALKDESCETIRVVSTQLVEAGVDIDFPVVYRQEAGLDSILQAAGRCNREGRLPLSTTYVFSLTKEHNLPKGEISDANNARMALKEDSDWFAPATMTEYFKQLYSRKSSFDVKGIDGYLCSPTDVSFETASNEFRLIDDGSVSLIVAWKDSLELVDKLKHDGVSYKLMKQLSKYTVNVYNYDFNALNNIGVVKEVADGIYLVQYKEQYDKDLGLLTDNQWDDKNLLI